MAKPHGVHRFSRPACALVLLLGGCGATPPEVPLAALTLEEVPAAPGSAQPNLAVGPDGAVYLSWIEPAGSSEHSLRYAVRRDGVWNMPATIARGMDWFVNWADFPSLAVTADGALVAHWLVRSGPGTYAYDVHLARSTDGGTTWSEAVVPHRDGTETEHGFVSLLPTPDGDVLVLWLDGREYDGTEHDGEMTLRAARFGAGGVGDEVLLDARTCDCCQTAAALTAEGPVVLYRDRSAGEIRDIAITRLVDGAWTDPRPVHDDGWRIEGCPVNGPAVSADGRRLAVAWFTAARDTARVLIAFSEDAGAGFADPVRVDDGAPDGRVDVELLPDGSALVSWLERNGENAEIRVRRVGPDGTIGPAVTVAATSASRASGFPRMARSGNVIVFAWTEPWAPARVRSATARITAAPGAVITFQTNQR